MADRTVTTRLKLDTLGFTAGGNSAKGTLRDLDRKFRESAGFAQGFRKQLEDAAKRLPPIDIDVNSSAAEVKLAEIRSRLESLSSKTVGVDIDAGEAYTELQALQRELQAIDDNDVAFEVKAGVSQALADLAVVDREISRVDGRNASIDVNADVGGALSSIAMVGAALAALPAVTTIAVGVMALGGAFAAAGIGAAAFSAAAVPALGRINQALTAQESAAKGAGAATGGAGQSAAQAAQQAMQLEQAEKRLKDAQAERKAAQEDLTRATEAGRRALEDLNFSLERSVLSQKDAALAVREAEARLLELQSKDDASDLEIERAMLNVEMAHQRAREQEVKTTRAKKDTAEANKAGVKGTAEYQKGLDKLAQAEDKVAQATAALKQMQLQQQAAMSGGGGGAAKLKDAFADLSAQEKVLAKDIKAFKDEYVDWQRALEPDVFPVIAQGLDLMRLGLKEATPLAKSASGALLTLGKDAERSLRGPFWQQFLFDVQTQIPGALTGLGRSVGNVTVGIAGIVQAFLPFTPTVVGGAERASEAFARWGKELKSSKDFQEFMAWAKANAPEVWQDIQNIATAIGHTAQAVAPLGIGAFSGIGLLAKLVAGMDPEHIRAIALAIAAIKTAQAGLNVANFFTDFVGKVGDLKSKVSDFGGTVDKVKSKASGLKGGISSLADSFGGLSGLVGGAALTGGLFILDDMFAKAAKNADQFAEKVAAVGGSNIDKELAALNAELKKQNDLAGPNILGWIYFSDAGEEAANRADALTSRIEDLNHQKELAAIKAKAAGDGIATMGSQAATSAGQVGGLDQQLGTFAARTDAVQAVRSMETAFKDARTAMDRSAVGLDITKAKTDAQRDAVVQAREKFSAYIDSIRTAADGAQTLSGRTSDGTRTILEQLPHLASLAGKNAEAKEQVLLLAKAYGISRDDAIKAMSSAEGLKKVLAELKSKEIRIGLTMDVSKAEEEFGSFIKRYSNKSLAIALATKVKAAGGIQTRSGVDLMAAGGLKGSSSTSPPPPAIRSQPTYVPGDRVGTVYAEAGREAYIPYDTSYRQRAIKILGQVASDFGLELYSADAEKKTTTLVAGLQTTNTSITSSLADATRELGATLGSSGTLTQSVASVGTLGSQVAQSWVTGSKTIGESVTEGSKTVSGSVTGMADAVTVGSDKIVKATDLVKEAALRVADVISKAPSGTGKGSQGSTNVPAPGGSKGSGKGSQGSTNVPAPPAPKAITVGADQVAGMYGVSASSYSQMTNSSRVSAPSVVVMTVPVPAATSSAGTGAGRGAAAAPAAGGVSVPITMNGVTIREEADVTKVGREIGWNVNAYG